MNTKELTIKHEFFRLAGACVLTLLEMEDGKLQNGSGANMYVMILNSAALYQQITAPGSENNLTQLSTLLTWMTKHFIFEVIKLRVLPSH